MKLFFVKTDYANHKIAGYTAYQSDKDGYKVGSVIITTKTAKEAVLFCETQGYTLAGGDDKVCSVMDDSGTGGTFTSRDLLMQK